ncbi:NAD(P)/FAD-dependent oxidoreductase [Halorhodospira halochloris]|uniref:NAD(P)/FAD-dependent oxidoreductase n=1 Tax=Halorhodospira halochloris TaxID=1052 RepID=UPI001EE7E4E3|nr:FAD-dependent oxidoreductase [Halorhodospira halochloris]MCG5548549.1 FAD-dependent oxidoreductase [Halorhodospira halochloris]
MQTTDFLVIGAGVVGLTIARQIQISEPRATVTVIDKEPGPGHHASGRNSGVLHSGIYYTADSLKARFSRDGNTEWQSYCAERNLPVDRCGKLIVPRTAQEHQQLSLLEQRGADNGVEVQRLDEKQVRAIEPRINTCSNALFIPSTATIDPQQLVQSLQKDIEAAGGKILFNCPYKAPLKTSPASSSTPVRSWRQGWRHEASKDGFTAPSTPGQMMTPGRFLEVPTSSSGFTAIQAGNEHISAGRIINCAGLYADRIAHDFGFGKSYAMLPFKGLYLYAAPSTTPPRTHVYPVPDLKTPFLGVHLTRTINGGVKLGPTATPAMWREHYSGLHRFRLGELLEIAGHEAYMLATNRNRSRIIGRQELKKRDPQHLINQAEGLLEGLDQMGFRQWGKPGIRAQLVERQSRELVMDFTVEGDGRSLHILNAVSPALTCALPFARYIVKDLLQLSS